MRGIDPELFKTIGLSPDAHDAVIRIQTFYRVYLIQQRFKRVVYDIVQRLRREALRVQSIQREEDMLASFRDFLLQGFHASKLSSHGKWKSCSFHLKLDAKQELCYLTWEPSTKIGPKLNMHQIDRVELIGRRSAVPKLESISRRKSLIIFSKLLPQGSMIIQFDSSRERDLMYKGLTRMVHDIRSASSQMDETGVLRHQSHKQALLFFDEHACAEREIVALENPQEQAEMVVENTTTTSKKPSDTSGDGLEEFYHTRFDHYPTGNAPTSPRDEAMSRQFQEEHDLDELFNKQFKMVNS